MLIKLNEILTQKNTLLQQQNTILNEMRKENDDKSACPSTPASESSSDGAIKDDDETTEVEDPKDETKAGGLEDDKFEIVETSAVETSAVDNKKKRLREEEDSDAPVYEDYNLVYDEDLGVEDAKEDANHSPARKRMKITQQYSDDEAPLLAPVSESNPRSKPKWELTCPCGRLFLIDGRQDKRPLEDHHDICTRRYRTKLEHDRDDDFKYKRFRHNDKVPEQRKSLMKLWCGYHVKKL
jgi:hypothetical protein